MEAYRLSFGRLATCTPALGRVSDPLLARFAFRFLDPGRLLVDAIGAQRTLGLRLGEEEQGAVDAYRLSFGQLPAATPPWGRADSVLICLLKGCGLQLVCLGRLCVLTLSCFFTLRTCGLLLTSDKSDGGFDAVSLDTLSLFGPTVGDTG